MNPIKAIVNIFVIALSVLGIAACGGGGGNGGSSSISVPTAGVSISTSNAKPVSAAILKSIETVEGTTTGTTVLSGVSVSAPASNFNYADFFVRQLSRLPEMDIIPSSTVSGVFISGSAGCTNGGTVSGTGNVYDENTLNLGDSLTLSFLSCSEDGVVLSGTMSISITQVTPNLDWTPPYALEVNVDMENFTVNDGGSVTTTNGDMLMLLAEDLGGNEYIQLSGTSLTASAGGQAERLTSYYFLIGGNNNTGDFGVILNATYASTKIDGSVSFTTVTPFTGNDLVANGEATAGELHITTSADSSQAWLIAQPDGINVQIDIDSDGDNTVDNTVMTTWTELMSL